MFNPEGLWDSSYYLVSWLPALAVLLPLAGSLLVVAAGKLGDKGRDPLVLGVTALTAALVAALYPLVVQGPLRLRLEVVEGFNFILKVDFLSFLLALLFSLIWFLAALFGRYYFAGTHAKTRLYVFFLSTLGHVLGVAFAGDLFSFFLFFELMTFSAFVLFIHNQTPEALQAGIIYIFMGVIGGLSLLMGIFLVYHATGTLEMVPLLAELRAAGANVPLIFLFFLLGFGIKMGMVPLHIWMPKAYGASPPPVNALSSAAMIKAGAYGLIRVLLLVLGPGTPGSPVDSGVQGLGLWVLWLGLATMLAGALMALFQQHSLKILAYSSISQMGYVMVGVGAAAYLGAAGAMGYAGAVFHMVNHAFLKAGLFLVLGALVLTVRDPDCLPAEGGGKGRTFLMIIFIIAALGMGGVPGFNGYISKTLLHHALVKAYQFQSVPALWAAEKLFMVASALTVCYFIKFFQALFRGEGPSNREISPLPLPVKGVLTAFGAVFIGIGLFPGLLYQGLILPSLGTFAFDPANVARYLEGINFFVPGDLLAAAQVLVLGLLVYSLGNRFGWFYVSPPAWLRVEDSVYMPLVRLATLIACRGGCAFDNSLNRVYDSLGRTTRDACTYVAGLDRSYEDRESGLRESAAGKSRPLEEKAKEHRGLGPLRNRFKLKPGEFDIKNLNFDTLLLAFMLAIFLVFLVYFSTAQ